MFKEMQSKLEVKVKKSPTYEIVPCMVKTICTPSDFIFNIIVTLMPPWGIV